MPDTITGRKEGTRFATDVQIYDPETGDIIASLAEIVLALADLTDRVEDLESEAGNG